MEVSDIKKLATLARLRFSEEEMEQFLKEMDEIVAFADTINNSVEGSTDQIRGVGSYDITYEELRPDEVREYLPNEKILSNVEGDKGCFVVKRCVK